MLATVAHSRELSSADSSAEVLSWRIDAFLTDGPVPPASSAEPAAPACQPYESAASARTRLTDFAVTTLGPQLAGRAQGGRAWPALIAALRRAESAGSRPVDALTRTVTARELGTARSVSEVLAWRINRHVAAHLADTATGPDTAAPAGSPGPAANHAAALLPWVPGPRPATSANVVPLTRYISDAANTVTARVAALIDNAVRYRPPWISLLGEQPADPDHAGQWRAHVAIVSAYRDQHKVTTDDPRQVLGSYPADGQAGHNAYWYAVESVLVARRLSGLEPDSADNISSTDSRASAQVAADIYATLPHIEREAIAAVIAETPGIAWLGHPNSPDEHAAAQLGYAGALTATLARRGHMTLPADPVRADGEKATEPVEAGLSS